MHFLERALTWCARALAVVGGVTMVIMMVHVMSEVFARYFFITSIPGTEELVSGYYMVAVVFLPLGLVQLERGHLCIELFTLWMNSRQKAWLDGIVLIVCACALSVFVYASFDKAVEMTRKGEIWIGMVDVMIWPARWMLPIGLATMTLLMLLQAAQELRSAFTGEGHDDPKPPQDSEQV